MKKTKTSFIFLMIILIHFSSLAQEKEKSSTSDVIVNPAIDSWRYWLELEEQGITKPYPFKETAPPVEKGHLITISQKGIESSDIELWPNAPSGANQSENSVSVSPLDNQVVLISSNTAIQGVSHFSNANFSFNGGETWNSPFGAPGEMNGADPAVQIGLDGTSYIGHIDVDPYLGQVVSISPDYGENWSVTEVAGSNPLYLDKNHLWIDNSPNSPHEGNLYDAWTPIASPDDGEVSHYTTVLSRSTDGGLNWSDPILLSDPNNGEENPILNQGVNIQTGPLGEVYAVWAIYDEFIDFEFLSGENALGFTKSTDGGLSFSSPVRIQNNLSGIRHVDVIDDGNGPTGKSMKTNSYPSMAVDISGGQYNGKIYVVWTNQGVPGTGSNSDDDVSIYITSSEDQGETWSTPTRVNQDPLGNVQYFSWITCDPVNGDLSVIFYDDRDVEFDDQVETWVATSQDGGDSWVDFRVSDVAFTPQPIFGSYMGDYIGITARGGMVYPVWTDNRTGSALSYTSPFILGCLSELEIATDVIANDVDYQEAEFLITASNNVFSEGEAIYHAGEEVLLSDGFTSEEGAIMRAYIEGCSGDFIKSANIDPNTTFHKGEKPKPTNYFKSSPEASELKVFPNPSNGQCTVKLGEAINLEDFRINIYSMSRGQLQSSLFKNSLSESFLVDLSEYPSGIYFIEVIDNKTMKKFTGKVVKN